MPLSERRAAVSASPEQAWGAAYDFVTRCRAWAVGEIVLRRETGRAVAEWESYLAFTDHTLRELEAGTLDAWFEPASGSAPS
jgi:hypothetical protein